MILSRHNLNPEEFALDILLFIHEDRTHATILRVSRTLSLGYMSRITDSARRLAPEDKVIDLTTSLSDGEIPHPNMIQPKES
jgi:hypothetical protein